MGEKMSANVDFVNLMDDFVDTSIPSILSILLNSAFSDSLAYLGFATG